MIESLSLNFINSTFSFIISLDEFITYTVSNRYIKDMIKNAKPEFSIRTFI